MKLTIPYTFDNTFNIQSILVVTVKAEYIRSEYDKQFGDSCISLESSSFNIEDTLSAL